MDRLESDWTSYLATLTPAQLETRVGYINSQGERWHSSLRDIMTHLSLHSAYHRGQIALLLGQAEHRPAYTDFIHATRQDLV